MMLNVYLGMLRRAEELLASSYRVVGDGHAAEPDVHGICHLLARQCDAHERALRPVLDRYGERPGDEPDRLHVTAIESTRSGPVGLLRDLQDLCLIAQLVATTYTVVKQAAAALRDEELLGVIADCDGETETQIAWIFTRMKQAAPQALVVAG
jgi:hypothetical protein